MNKNIYVSDWSESSSSIADDIKKESQRLRKPLTHSQQFAAAEFQRNLRVTAERLKEKIEKNNDNT